MREKCMIKRSIEKIFLRLKCCNEFMNRITMKSPRAFFFQDCMERELLEAWSLDIHEKLYRWKLVLYSNHNENINVGHEPIILGSSLDNF